jgi:anionic cell wall polymer biosynthesis LytR-Cps2A-Psr (LCP) family protein
MQYYVLIDMQGFVPLIDALGGVDITVEERLPIGGDVRNDGTLVGVNAWVEAGPQHMDGNTALWYARSRHSTNDYDRMQRQRVLQEAILRQFDPANVLVRFQGVAAAGAQTVSTDIPQGMLGRFTDLALLAKDQPITELELTPPLVETDAPDFGAIRALVAAAVTPPTATPAP